MFRFHPPSPPPYGNRNRNSGPRESGPWSGDAESPNSQWNGRGANYASYRMPPPRQDKGLLYGPGMSSKLQQVGCLSLLKLFTI